MLTTPQPAHNAPATLSGQSGHDDEGDEAAERDAREGLADGVAVQRDP